MKPIKINPELGNVTEKLFLGLELWQLVNLGIGMLLSLGMILILPDLGMLKGIISAIPALPFVIIALKPFYGLKGMQLAKAAFRSMINRKPLTYESEEWKEVNRHC